MIMNNNSHGGARPGAGRPKLPQAQKQIHVTVSVLPRINSLWNQVARKNKISKGEVVAQLLEERDWFWTVSK